LRWNKTLCPTVDWVKEFNIEISIGSRIYSVLKREDQKVSTWLKEFEV